MESGPDRKGDGLALPVGKSNAAAAVLLPLLLLHGCATATPSAQQETPSTYSVRFPGSDPMELEARSPSPVVQPELPATDADEKKGRWLRVIEVERTPHPAAPTPGEGSPPGD